MRFWFLIITLTISVSIKAKEFKHSLGFSYGMAAMHTDFETEDDTYLVSVNFLYDYHFNSNYHFNLITSRAFEPCLITCPSINKIKLINTQLSFKASAPMTTRWHLFTQHISGV